MPIERIAAVFTFGRAHSCAPNAAACVRHVAALASITAIDYFSSGIRLQELAIVASARRVGEFVRISLLAPAVFRDADEQARIGAFFGGIPGVFVEVGANDPVLGSQSYALEQQGWTGVLVEPLRECAAMLRRRRQAQVFECAAGSPDQAGRMLPMLVAGGLSTLRPRIEEGTAARETRMVPVRTLDSILSEAGISRIDFVSIDVEGAEIDVLQGFAVERYRPRLILLEDDARTRDKHHALSARGYKLVRRTNLNNWYVPRDAVFRVSLCGRWQLWRKMYLGAPLRRWKARRRRRTRG